MNTNRGQLGRFEEKLLDELKQVVTERAAAPAATADRAGELRNGRTRRRLVLIGAAGTLAAGVTVGLPLLVGDNSGTQASAFEVTTNNDGTVTVTIHSFKDADDLESQLEDVGVPAQVDYTQGDQCQADRGDDADHLYLFESDMVAGAPLTFTVRPSDFRPDETLVVNTGWSEDNMGSTGFITNQLITGPVAPCVPGDHQPS